MRQRIALLAVAVALFATGVVVAVDLRNPTGSSSTIVNVEIATGGSSALPGTLTLPAGSRRWPAVVLVAGSGPHDRDETIGALKPFRDIALGLARRGVATYRFDKRTKVRPGDFVGRSFTVNDEYVDDAVAAVRMIRQRKEIDADRVFVLGHSQGGTVAPRIVAAEPSVAGLILLAASTEPLQRAIVRQTELINDLDGSVTESDTASLDAVSQQAAAIESPTLSPATPLSQTFGIPASYWLDLRSYDPAEAAAKIDRPVLVLQGGNDYQVTSDSYDAYKRAFAGRDDATFRLYPRLTHPFIDGPATPAVYRSAGHVSTDVIRDIASWATSQH